MELVLSLCLGIGLAAACGFRVFTPLLALSVATMAGHVQLAEGFSWIGSWPALICFLTALVLEVIAYYIPWLDNLLDSLSTPAAIVAGTILTAAVITDLSPLMKWSLALIAGGGTAGLVQATTVALRGGSSLSTGGFGNWSLATGELAASLTGSVLALFAPVLATIGLLLLLVAAIAWFRRGGRRQRSADPA